MKTTHGLLHLDKRNVVLWKLMDIPKSFIWIIIFFDEALWFEIWRHIAILPEMHPRPLVVRSIYFDVWDDI
jgi:hypothetical protein